MDAAPDLSAYFAIHQRMRSDLRSFVAAVALARSDERGGRLRFLARWATGFGHELRLHHTVEDDVIFADLASRVPTSWARLSKLAVDHEAVAALLRDFGPAANRLADRHCDFDDAKSELLAISIELRDRLEPHIDVEDEDVLPLFYRHYSAAEYDALQARVGHAIPKQRSLFSIPWNLAAQPPAIRAQMLAEGSIGLRLINRLTARPHARLVAAVFASVDPNDQSTTQPATKEQPT